MRLVIDFAPEIRNHGHRLSESDMHHRLVAIVDYHLGTEASALDTVCNISRAALQEIDRPNSIYVRIRLPREFCSAPGLRSAELVAKTISPRAYDHDGTFFELYTYSKWYISMRLEGDQERQRHDIRLEIKWNAPLSTGEHEYGVGASGLRDQRASTELPEGADLQSTKPFPTFNLHCQLAKLVEGSNHASYDSLAAEAARLVFQTCEATIGPQRVSAFVIMFGDVRSVERKTYQFNPRQFADFQHAQRASLPVNGRSRAFIALGSNVGDRISMIENACLELGRRDLKVLRTSSLYETEPMYKTDQPPFLNGVCEVCALRVNSTWAEDVD